MASGMDSNKLRMIGTKMLDFVANYWETLDQRKPFPDLNPGFMNDLIPPSPPNDVEDWEKIFRDIEPVVCNGNTHWQHPNFYAYYPTGCSYHSIVADILSAGLASIGFSWSSSPSMTELELRMTDWIAKVLHLPDIFLNASASPGGGIIQNTASDATMVAMLAARGRAVKRIKQHAPCSETTDKYGVISIPENHDPEIFSRFIAYCSDQAHSSVEKAAMLNGVRLRKLRSERGGEYDNFRITPEVLEGAIMEDRKNNLIPFILIATVGTTSTCAVDPIDALAPICNREQIWVHVDSAYAGSFMICPEYRNMCKDLQLVDSFNTNIHKSLMINFDCSPMWFKDAQEAIHFFSVQPPYLQHRYQKQTMDYRHLQIALGRRFRSLKIWFVLRNMGTQELQNYLRKMVDFAKIFENLIKNDPLFELFVPRHLGLVCFRLKNSTNELNSQLYDTINNNRIIHLTSSTVHGETFMRFTICSSKTTEENVRKAYEIIHETALKVLEAKNA